jgi:hypothetical protein
MQKTAELTNILSKLIPKLNPNHQVMQKTAELTNILSKLNPKP